MKILIVSSTSLEINQKINKQHLFRNVHIDFLITGVGMVATTYFLTKKLSENRYDFIINVGIAGALDNSLLLGDVCEVEADCFADLGVEDHDEFLSLFDLGFMQKNEFPFQEKLLKSTNPFQFELTKKQAITVNKAHGNEASILLAKKLYINHIESMEGAAFFYVCLQEKIPCAQIRAISNYVEKRDKTKWNIPLAVENLNVALKNILIKLDER
jgi:futalosine hydrolase